MYQGKTFLGIIPARGGSKGLPRKNVRNLAGKPLIAWTIEAAAKSQYLDWCVVSTDDEDIAEVSKSCGGIVPFLRPAELAQDNTPSVDVVLHVLDMFPEYEYIVLLQPTSPLRLAEDIDGTIRTCLEHEATSCVSITETEQSPYWMYRIDERGRIRSMLKISAEHGYQRQKLPKTYHLNGAVYVARADFLRRQRGFIGKETFGYIMPLGRSWDIDTLLDFEFVELLMQKQRKS